MQRECSYSKCKNRRVHWEHPDEARGYNNLVDVPDNYPENKKISCSLTCGALDGAISFRQNNMFNQKEKSLIQEAYDLLLPVPEEEWITHAYSDGQGCCATGHLQRLRSKRPLDRSFENCLPTTSSGFIGALIKLTHRFSQDCFSFVSVNDKASVYYSQDSSKKRVITLLQDMLDA